MGFDFFNVLSLIGGLSLFLFGMNIMGDSLAKTAGGKLERILEKLTSTPIRGVLLGAAVTGVIQSSSATTVMVVGFVNYEAVTGNWHHNGCQYWNDSYFMDFKSYRN